MSTKFLTDNDMTEFLAASDAYSRMLNPGMPKTASVKKASKDNFSTGSFFVELSKELNDKPTDALHSLDAYSLNKLAQDVGAVPMEATRAGNFIDNIEFAAACGRDIAHEHVKEANIGRAIARFAAGNPRAAGAIGGAAVSGGGTYLATGDAGAALGAGALGAGAGALGGRKLMAMSAKGSFGKGVKNYARQGIRENVIAKQTAGRIGNSAASSMKQTVLPGMEDAVGAKPLQSVAATNATPAMKPAGPTVNSVSNNPAQGELFGPSVGVNPYAPGTRPVAPKQKVTAPNVAPRAGNHPNNNFEFGMARRAQAGKAAPSAPPASPTAPQDEIFSMARRAKQPGLATRTVQRAKSTVSNLANRGRGGAAATAAAPAPLAPSGAMAAAPAGQMSMF